MHSSIELKVAWKNVKYDLIEYEELDSTNSQALRMLSYDPRLVNTVLTSKTQTLGRGKRGNTWVSPKGNFYCSIIFKTHSLDTNFLPFLTVVSIGEAINLKQVIYKWPNDLLIKDKKFGGILIESHRDYTYVIGIGININSNPIENSTIIGKLMDFDVEDLLKRILIRLEVNKLHFENSGFCYIRKKWLEHSATIGSYLAANNIKGKFGGINSKGYLKLVDENGKIHQFSSATVCEH